MPREGPDPELDIREHLAAERTLLAYIRTSLALMGFGFVVARFGLVMGILEGRNPAVDAAPALGAWFGTALVVVGVLASAGSAWVYRRELGRLNRRAGGGEAYPPSRLALFLALSLSAIGAAMAFYLAFTSGS